MRRGQRFTPQKLNKWAKDGRGSGTGADYQCWHQIRRSDPPSRGQSSIWFTDFERQQDLLSGAELVGLTCVSRLLGVGDVLEQFPLPCLDSDSVLARYSAEYQGKPQRGTLALAAELGFKHPDLIGPDGVRCDWVMTSDLVVILKEPVLRVLVISIKNQYLFTRRDRELLEIEKRYWQAQGATWLLFNVNELPNLTRLSVLSIAPYVCGRLYPSSEILDEVARVVELHATRLADALKAIQARFAFDHLTAQKLFWQTVWTGRIPVDLQTNFCRAGKLTRAPAESWCQWDPLKGVATWI